MGKENLKKEFSELATIIEIIFIVVLFFYIGQLIWPYINLPFSNPEQIPSGLVKQNFNPLSNSLRFVFSLILSIGGPTMLLLFGKEQRKKILRTIFVLTLLVSYFLIAFIHPAGKYFVDLFHDGEQFGNAVLVNQGRPLYSGIIFYHGAFTDPLIANLSFWLFGKAIGSYLLLTVILRLTTFTVFFILLGLIIKNEVIFYLSSLWFFNFVSNSVDFQGINFTVSTIRDMPVWISLILIWFLVEKNYRPRIILFLIGLISGLEYVVSLDRAYLLSALFIFVLIFLFFIKRYKRNLILISLGGFLIGFFIQLPFIGLAPFLEFLRFSFWDLPRVVSIYSEHIFPSYSQSPSSWFPIILIIFAGIYLSKIFLSTILVKDKKKIKLESFEIYSIILFVFSTAFFRIAITRDDYYHLFYGSTLVFVTAFYLADIFVLKGINFFKKNLFFAAGQYLLAAILIVYFLFDYNAPLLALGKSDNLSYQKLYFYSRPQCFLDFELERDKNFQSFLDYYLLNHLRCVPYKLPGDIKSFLLMTQKDDLFWLTSLQAEAVNYINSKISENDYVFVFSNEPGYYYFLKGKSPTRFSEVSTATTEKYRQELLQDLKNYPPKLILYSTGNFPETIEDIPMRERLPEVDGWLLENYPVRKEIRAGGRLVVILSQKEF